MSIRRIFEYAVIWKAIVLMDEADIFLAQRDTENIERNALVSVFLRNLEYFDGIMILTTNRVGVIDEAFQSRLDVALALEPFTINERTDVWFNFIEDLPPQISEKERDLLRREVKKVWSHKDLNGRQIKNCVKTASVLAKQVCLLGSATTQRLRLLWYGTSFVYFASCGQKSSFTVSSALDPAIALIFLRILLSTNLCIARRERQRQTHSNHDQDCLEVHQLHSGRLQDGSGAPRGEARHQKSPISQSLTTSSLVRQKRQAGSG